MEEKFNEAMSYYDSGDYKKSISLLTPLADAGHVEACFMLGFIYCKGIGIRKNYKKSFNLLEFAVSKNHTKSLYLLAVEFYEKGCYIKKDLKQSINLLEKCVKRNYTLAYYALGKIHITLKDYKKSLQFFHKGAEQENIFCQFALANLCYNTSGYISGYFEDIYDCVNAIEIFSNLMEEYQKQKKVPLYHEVINNKNSIDDICAEENIEDLKDIAKFNFAMFVLLSKNKILSDETLALNYLNELSDNNSSTAQKAAQDLILWYYKSINDDSTAFKYVKKFKNNFELALCYYYGVGCEKNYEEAFKLFKKLERYKDINFPHVRMLLAEMYYYGNFVDVDFYKSFTILDDLITTYHDRLVFFIETSLTSGCFGYTSLAAESYARYATLWLNGYCEYNKPNKYKAKDYFETACSMGFTDCETALESVLIELNISKNENKLKNLLNGLLEIKATPPQIYQTVEKQLKMSIDKYYLKLPHEVRSFFINALSSYVFYKSCDSIDTKHYSIDFSSSILLLCKGLESILRKIFYDGYIKYLETNNISPSEFNLSQNKFVKRDIKTSNIVYVNPEKNAGIFTLGSLYHFLDITQSSVIKDGKETKTKEINPHMMAYLKKIWKCNESDETLKKEKITQEILSITNKLSLITPQIRNLAVHETLEPSWRVESLANQLLLIKDNFICEILSHLKPSALKVLK